MIHKYQVADIIKHSYLLETQMTTYYLIESIHIPEENPEMMSYYTVRQLSTGMIHKFFCETVDSKDGITKVA